MGNSSTMCEFLPSDEVALDNYAAVRGSLPESGIGNPQTALEAAKNMCMMLRERGEAATHAESLRDAADMLNGHRAALDWILSRPRVGDGANDDGRGVARHARARP